MEMGNSIYYPFLNGKYKSALMYDCYYLKICMYVDNNRKINKKWD